MDEQNRNLILATALSFAVILVWFLLFPPEATAPPPAQQPGVETTQDGSVVVPPADGTVAQAPELAAAPADTRAAALARTERIAIETARLEGSLSLVGGRIDDIKLKDYTVTIAEDSPDVTLLTPAGAGAVLQLSFVPIGLAAFVGVIAEVFRRGEAMQDDLSGLV